MLTLKNHIKKLISLVLLVSLFFIFQNCENYEFNSSVGGSLVPSGDEVSTISSDIIISNDDKLDENSDPLDKHYRCNLAGPGKSIHLSLINSDLLPKSGMPHSVCMTKYACESIVSKAYEIKSADYSVQCQKNIAGTIQLSDFEIENLLFSK
jgi:hypothetical protein